MDRRYVEPGDRLHEDWPGLRQLLCVCYVSRFAERWRGIEGHPYEQGFDLRLCPNRVDQPIRWRKLRLIFVNSMSDVFHKRVPVAFIDTVFDIMERADHHIYLVLSKRSSLMRRYVNRRYPGTQAPHHIWLGVSIMDSDHIGRLVLVGAEV